MSLLKQTQFLPISLEEAWSFFATPRNLNEVTPKDMNFTITSDLPEKMYEGLMITYKLKPMWGISITWWTEITHINEPQYFVDEQRKGPYKIWHHEHHFTAVEGGVLMTDILYYEIGMSFLGWIAGHLFVHKKVKQIFSHRYHLLESLFKTE
jgi:ligand-binding SRPBCC domain-containing protein